ncbi:MAG: hypothetical protein KF726_05620 [Anaerolineae bacterium]|nr:hypothetical protein [Anaerolineae bacterium]
MTAKTSSNVDPTKAKTVSAYFDRVSDGWSAVQALLDAGIPRDQISFIASQDAMKAIRERPEEATTEKGSTGSGVAAGSVIGGAAGSLLSLLAAAALPGVGAVLAFGPLFSAFAGGVAGSVAGGYIGARLKWQQADEETQAYYTEGVRRGGALLFVDASAADAEHLHNLLQQHNGTDVRKRAQQWQSEGWQPALSQVDEDEQTKPDNASRSGKFPGVPPFTEIVPVYQQHFAETFPKQGYKFPDFSAGYMYGYNLANDERYRDQAWSEIEDEIRADWAGRPHGDWGELSQIIQFARDKALGRI